MKLSFLIFVFISVLMVTPGLTLFGLEMPTSPLKSLFHTLDPVNLAEKLIEESPASKLASATTNYLLNKVNTDINPTTVTSLITSQGFQVEEHIVVTDDGYVLTVHHIPSKNPSGPGGNRVVYLQHGLLDSSATWVVSGNGSLAFILSNLGFDVWMGNSRGNRYASNHSTLKSTDPAFWAFSWDEMAQYDLPASLTLVLTVTGANSLTYIGHSQGCSIAFALLSSKPEWQKKINLFFSLAPAPILGHMKLPFIHQLSDIPVAAVNLVLGKNSFLQSAYDAEFNILCNISPLMCHNILCITCGCNSSTSVPTDRTAFIMQYFPSGTSVNNMLHYTQSFKSGRFQKYDFGQANQQKYNASIPPVYQIGGITTPTIFFYGSYDELADATDVELLMSMLNTAPLEKVKVSYGHGDFVWATTATLEVYQPLVNFLFKYIGRK